MVDQRAEFILVQAGQWRHHLAWAHIVAVRVGTLQDRDGSERLQAELTLVTGGTITVWEDEARKVDQAVLARGGVSGTAAPQPAEAEQDSATEEIMDRS